MRKQELIHVHGLLAEVSSHCEQSERLDLDLEEYRAQGTRPTSIHQSKDDHKQAVFALTESITSALRSEEAEAVSASAD